MTNQEKILVIKLSALGDFVQNFGIMRAIRAHHPAAHISILTTAPYQDLAKSSGYFDEVLIDLRPKFYQLKKWFCLKRTLNKENFSTVYDLQINDRTALYYSLFKAKPNWIGALNKNDRDKSGLAFYRHKKMLEAVNVKDIKIDKLEWMKIEPNKFSLQTSYALIVPGCAPSRPEKRWPAEHYAKICQKLVQKNIRPVLIGTKNEGAILDQIQENCPESLNLKHQTNLYDIAALARNAQFAIGNDTGPMHIIGPTGCPCIVLFSGSSTPAHHAPLGNNIYTIQQDNIADIHPKSIFDKIENTFLS